MDIWMYTSTICKYMYLQAHVRVHVKYSIALEIEMINRLKNWVCSDTVQYLIVVYLIVHQL